MTGSHTSRLWTAFCDWLKDFCRSWSRASELWTCDCSIDTCRGRTGDALEDEAQSMSPLLTGFSQGPTHLLVCAVGLRVQLLLQLQLLRLQAADLPTQFGHLNTSPTPPNYSSNEDAGRATLVQQLSLILILSVIITCTTYFAVRHVRKAASNDITQKVSHSCRAEALPSNINFLANIGPISVSDWDSPN